MARQPSESKYLATFCLGKNTDLERLFRRFFHTKSNRFTRFHNRNVILTQPDKMNFKKYFVNKTRCLSKKCVASYF